MEQKLTSNQISRSKKKPARFGDLDSWFINDMLSIVEQKNLNFTRFFVYREKGAGPLHY